LWHNDAVVACWAFELKTGPGFVVSDVLATLRAGEFHVGHAYKLFLSMAFCASNAKTNTIHDIVGPSRQSP
jgi:hypothetical protein